jgi:hypothetical protein
MNEWMNSCFRGTYYFSLHGQKSAEQETNVQDVARWNRRINIPEDNIRKEILFEFSPSDLNHLLVH